MTEERLTALLAQRVMGWTVGPERFMMGGRRWLPRWRFQPTENLLDAFRLLDGAAPDEYNISGDDKGNILVRVRIGGVIGEARGVSTPLAISHAIAAAIGIGVEP